MNMNAAQAAASTRHWLAKMVAPRSDAGQGTPASFIATTFLLDDAESPAELLISAQGLYRCFLNGQRVGHDLLTPGFTNYDRHIPFQRYSVEALLRSGENRIVIWLADGWFRSQLMWGEHLIFNCWGDRIAAIAELRRGKRILVATDESWRSGQLPVRKSGIYFGETFDARQPILETDGVDRVMFDCSQLVAQQAPAVRELDELTGIDRWKDDEGRLIVDFGQNLAGYVRYLVRGERGAIVTVEHSEVLGPGRAFDNRNYRSAMARTTYMLAGHGEESYAPHFTFQGFRYARITIAGKAELGSIKAVPISSLHETKGDFKSGHPLVNRLVQNTIWSQRGNFIEVPTDCPQRDERLGWTGDAQVFASTACWLADCHAFFRKYLRDMLVDQRPDGAVAHVSPDPTRLHPEHFPGFFGSTGWGDAIVIIPWTLYLHYGDRDVLDECFDGMVAWVDFVWSIADGPIVRPSTEWGGRGFTFGDWLQPATDGPKARPTISDDCAATIYHYISTSLVARIAGVLGRTETERAMSARAQTIRQAFANEYIAPSGRLGHNDQTSYALAFLHDLIPVEHVEAAKEYFRRTIVDARYHIGTGFIGTPALLPALTKLGMTDLAAKVFLQEDVPGWLYQVKMGATTVWERWDAIAPDGTIHQPEMNSYNHYSYGAVCQWLFESVAGISPDPEAPGFQRVIVAPSPIAALDPVSAHHETRFGRITAAWHVDSDQVVYRLVLPAGCTGVFRPGSNIGAATLDGVPITAGTSLSSGTHELRFGLTSST